MQVDFFVALMMVQIFLHGDAMRLDLGYWAMSGYNFDGIIMFKLTGKVAEDRLAVARSIEIRSRHVNVLGTVRSCTETEIILLLT